MSYTQVVSPNLSQKTNAGWCLMFIQNSFRAPVMHVSATEAANATKLRNTSRTMPNVSVPVWFDHWGTYGDYGGTYANWGHVVVWVPGRGFLSSPYSGFGQLWLSSLAAVENTFNSKYRFWSLDINTLLVAQPAQNKKGGVPMYHSNWIKDDYRQEVVADGKFKYLHVNRKKDNTIIFGPGKVVGEISVGIIGPEGAKATVKLVRDVTDSKGNMKSQTFVEEVDGVIPRGGYLVITLPGVNQVPKGQRLRGMLRVHGLGEKVTLFRYAQKFMVWK